jgi:hypothetical protein
MLRKQFEIPTDSIAEFTELLAETELANEIKGTNDNGEIIIEVAYNSVERDKVFDLVEWCDDNIVEDDDDIDADDEDTNIEDQ